MNTISVYRDGSYRIAHGDTDAAIDATFPDYVASGRIDLKGWSRTIAAQFETDSENAVEEGVARGFALGLGELGLCAIADTRPKDGDAKQGSTSE